MVDESSPSLKLFPPKQFQFKLSQMSDENSDGTLTLKSRGSPKNQKQKEGEVMITGDPW